MIRRRDFITLLGSAAAAWPIAARAQQTERVRRVGVLMNLAADDPEVPVSLGGFLQGLQEAGWSVGRNVRIDYRWAAGDAELSRKFAVELLSLGPEVVLAVGASTLAPLQHATRSVPIVFARVSDPVGGGFVASLARPGGNVTGFTQFEFGFGAKWLELLKEVAPHVTRVAILRDPTLPAGLGQFGAIQSVAPAFGVEVSPVDMRDAAELERALDAFALAPNGGLIIVSNPQAFTFHTLIVMLAARDRLPAVYPSRSHGPDQGLLSYGPVNIDMFRGAAGYVDRILRGEKPGDLPVQAATRYELVINLKAAKALGGTVPPTLLATADEVLE
jgi:putative tryptophan/tyrosine transport system substrate-binding protein